MTVLAYEPSRPAWQTRAMTDLLRSPSSVLLAAVREQVLEGGVGLTQQQALECLRLPDESLTYLLQLAHEVRMRYCGPEVELC